ncbi:hypothetical protein WN943_015553 [Citrus x changshan-huyou]
MLMLKSARPFDRPDPFTNPLPPRSRLPFISAFSGSGSPSWDSNCCIMGKRGISRFPQQFWESATTVILRDRVSAFWGTGTGSVYTSGQYSSLIGSCCPLCCSYHLAEVIHAGAKIVAGPSWPESELVKEVVNQILKRLAEVSLCSNKNQLVGVESRVEEIESLLGAGSKDVYALGIWSTGGIGKTTIARAIFDKISSNFEGSCFLQNVREESQRPGGLACLQQELFSKLLKEENVILDIALSFRRLSSRKFLIVLDDVTCFKQIKSLIGSHGWYMAESRII